MNKKQLTAVDAAARLRPAELSEVIAELAKILAEKLRAKPGETWKPGSV